MSAFFAIGAAAIGALEAATLTVVPTVLSPFTPPGAQEQTFVAVEIEHYVPGVGALIFDLAIGATPIGAFGLEPMQTEQTNTLYASDIGYIPRDGDLPAQVIYPPTLASGFAISRSARLEPWSGSGSVGWGTLKLIGLDGRYNAIFQSSNPDGRPIRVLRGTKTYDADRGFLVDPHYGSLVNMFSGVGNGL